MEDDDPAAKCVASSKQRHNQVQIELLADEEFALWDLAVLNAEQQSAENAGKLAISTSEAPAVTQAVSDQVSEAALGINDPAKPKLPEIEDFGLKKNRMVRHRPGGLMVTDIAAAEWCQQQVAFSLSARLPKEVTETAAMTAGTAIHAALEAELAKTVVLDTETIEDRWAVRLLNMMVCLHQLQFEGKTREMYIWGNFKGQWIRGIIDQLELDHRGRIRVVEHKTRTVPSLPRPAQQQTAKLQAMTYRLLLEQLSETCNLGKLLSYFHRLKLNPLQMLSEALQQHAQGLGIASSRSAGGQAVTLTSLAEHLHQQVLAMPQCSEEVSVQYIWQADNDMLGEVNALYDHKWVVYKLQQHVDFWDGTWKPEAVLTEDNWKCRHCMFCLDCPVGRESLK